MRHHIASILLILPLASCCVLGPGPDMLDRSVVADSVAAVTTEFDGLVRGAVERGEMDATEGDAWLGESALLRHIVTADPADPVDVPEPIANAPR